MRALVVAAFVCASSAAQAESGMASTFYDRVVACPPKRINPYKTQGIAHKTLPCGTLVEVINPRNKKRWVGPVIDIGPCTSYHCQTSNDPAMRRARKRSFDLLPLVAKAVGSDGLTRVIVTELR